jgi:hypothetical protein
MPDPHNDHSPQIPTGDIPTGDPAAEAERLLNEGNAPPRRRMAEESGRAQNGHAGGGARDGESEERAKRGWGYLFALLRTRRGPRIQTPEQVLRSAAAQGALAGCTPNGQPKDPGVKWFEAKATARVRASISARRRAEAVVADLRALELAGAKRARARADSSELTTPIRNAERRVVELEEEVVELAGEQQDPELPPLPSLEEQERIAEEEVPGYRVPAAAKAALFTASATVEALFTGSFVAAVATIGIPGVPLEVNIALPWAAGSAVGAIVPVAAERAAHAAAGAAPDAPWYVRHAPAIVIAVPASIGAGRAVAMAEKDLLSGLLGIGIALLLVSIAVVAAAVGHRESEGAQHDARRATRSRLRAERQRLLTPGPRPEARLLEAKRRLLDLCRRSRDGLLNKRSEAKQEEALAEDELAKARANLAVAEEASRLEAREEGGLAGVNVATYVQRRDAVSATRLARRPPAFTGEWPDEDVSDLPRLRVDELRVQTSAEEEASNDDETPKDDEARKGGETPKDDETPQDRDADAESANDRDDENTEEPTP